MKKSVLVAVDGGAHAWDALEWAAAEAAATGQDLSIVHVAEWPPVVDPWSQFAGEHLAEVGVVAEHVIDEAVRRAREVAPGIRILTEVAGDARPGRAILRAARQVSLIVLGRRRDGRALRSRFGVAVASYVAHRASAPVVIAGLADRAGGASAGRVAVLVDEHTDAFEALSLAFRAAQRRGIGVTVLHAGAARPTGGPPGATALVAAFRGAFDDDDVVEQHLLPPVGPAVSAAAQGAALLVLGARAARLAHRGQLPAASRAVAEAVRTPVVIVPATTAA